MKIAPIAKIARPKLYGIVKRARLFQLLDQGKQKPVIWITAQGGSGKTTLVADWLDTRSLPSLWYQVDEGDADIASFFYYMGMAAKNAAPRFRKPLPLLTPEYLQGIPVFIRRFFEELFSRVKSPSAIVLDNFQDAPPASGFHDMIAHGLDTIPEGITVIILSRVAPPLQLARLQANSRLFTIGWDEVRFTREESLDLLATQGNSKLSAETLNLLHDKTEGWAAGLILLAGAGAAESNPFADMTADKLFDYFASEIFSKTDAAVQDILLKTSFLQKIYPAMAEQLAGNAMAGEMLERMSRDHYFTQKYGQAYQYHPLFRAFLQSRAKAKLAPADMVAVQRKAAELLEQSGSAEDAIELYIAAKGWSNAERVVLKQAPALVSQGRNNVLEGWLNSFPQEYIANSAWMLYWLGGARMTYDPSQSRSYLEKAYALFESCNDVPGLFSAWAKIVDSFIHEWGDARPADHWIEALSGLTKKYKYPSAEIEAMVTASMVGILVHRQPTHPDFAIWEEKLERIVFNYPERDEKLLLGCSLMNSYSYVSGIQKATVIFKSFQQLSRKANIAPLTRLLWHLQEANYFWLTGDFQSCYQAILDGENVAQESGVHLLDSYILAHGVFTGIAFNRPEMTKYYMEKFSVARNSPRLLDKSLYHYTEASIEWYEKDFKKSMEHSKVALELAEAAGVPWPLSFCLLDYALTLFDVGHYQEAKSFHKRAGDYGTDFANNGYLYNMVGAKIYLGVGDHDRGLGFLKAAMNIGARNGYANMSRWNDQNMSRLCAKALEHNIEPDYVRKLIKTRGLVPEGAVANWPYPIRVHTLGRFELLKDDKPVTFSGKVQKKPIELLKALIAMGGQGVPEELLIDALWPDSEGDAGYGTLKTTILRLRQLLGCEEAVLVSGGAVTLDSRLCYVDAFAFEALMREAEKNPQTAVYSKAADLYQGRFLAADTASGWTVSLRERLRNKFIRFNLKVGKALEEQGIWAEAIEHYHRALEIDDLYEEFYQRLMSCHLQLGQYAEAASTYQRCKRTLLKTFGATLTSLTEALHQTALERKN